MRLIAIKHAQAGDVVYLHPEHKKYSYPHMGVVSTGREDCVVVVVTADEAMRITDMERCVEVVSRRLLARCAGITERRIDEACREAKAGYLIALAGDGSEPALDRKTSTHLSYGIPSTIRAAGLVPADEPQAQEAAATAMPDAEHDLSKPSWIKVNEVTGEESPDAPFDDVD